MLLNQKYIPHIWGEWNVGRNAQRSKGLKIPLHELLDVSIEVKPTNTEAFHRIQIAMQCLSEEEAVEVAEIIEKLIAFKYPQP